MSDNTLEQYLALSGSMTQFLEQLCDANVVAQVHAQSINTDEKMLLRDSTLHVGYGPAVLAARCKLSTSILTEAELNLLLETSTPIGSILLANQNAPLRRENVEVSRHVNHALNEYLAASDEIFSKTFDLWQGDRFIGRLEEIVSQASLSAAISQPALLAKSS